MKKIFLVFFFLFLINSCSTENVNGQQEGLDSLGVNKPQTKIIVNKEYDENGNLVKFDSSYSYYYSNMGRDSTLNDSTYSLFQKDFFNSFPNKQRPFLNDMFFEDSLLNYDFYKHDFFSNRFRFNRNKFDELFKEMDSIKNEFYRKNQRQKNK